jgi:hypothetical protein
MQIVSFWIQKGVRVNVFRSWIVRLSGRNWSPILKWFRFGSRSHHWKSGLRISRVKPTLVHEWSVSQASRQLDFRLRVDAFASRRFSLCDKFFSKWPHVGAVVIHTISIASISSSLHVTATTMTAKHHRSPLPASMKKWTILGHAAGRLRFHHRHHQLGRVGGALL